MVLLVERPRVMGVRDVVVAVARDDGGRKAVGVSLQDACEAPTMRDPVIARTIPRVSEQGRLRVRLFRPARC